MPSKNRHICSNDPFVEIGDIDKYYKESMEEFPDEEYYGNPFEWASHLTDDYVSDFMAEVANASSRRLKSKSFSVAGTYADWRGGHDVGAHFDSLEEAVDALVRTRYDHEWRMWSDEEGRTFFSESTHDTPMGGTILEIREESEGEGTKPFDLHMELYGC